MDKYEISLWEDTPEGENKLCVIGANDYLTGARAIEPKMIEKINGTHEFSFKMYHWYMDELTGEEYRNPFDHLLINERKVKVFWKDEWYDMVIKQCLEETRTRSTIYKCVDLYVNELSKNGYSLEFSTDLQNNIGTVEELATAVLEGSSWQYDANGSDIIRQTSEEVVYEATVSAVFEATPIVFEGTADDVEIGPQRAAPLFFYSEIQELLDLDSGKSRTKECQFVWTNDTNYAVATGDTLVTNAQNYLATFTWGKTLNENDEECLVGKINDTSIVTINLTNGVSSQYRAERLVNSQKTEFDPLLDRYVNVYNYVDTENDNENVTVYGVERTEYDDPLMCVDVITNGSKFTSVSGWTTDGNQSSSVTWNAVVGTTLSPRLIISGTVFNSGFFDHQAYFKRSERDWRDGDIGGIQKGDVYVLRFSRFSGEDKIYYNTTMRNWSFDILLNGNSVINFNNESITGDLPYITSKRYTFTSSISADQVSQLQIKITVDEGQSLVLKSIESFKYMTTIDSSNNSKMILPGDISSTPLARAVQRYYKKADSTDLYTQGKTPHELTYLDPTQTYVPVMNNYQRFGTIEIKGSNRFNILQTIGETFKCWVRFVVEHNETGKISIDEDSGRQRKYVRFLRTVGEDSGISFEYGIDLRQISRTIASDQIATKVIVLDNSNEFAPNGFCSIARSSENYTGENFVLDFGYYVQQGLLNEEQLLRDLYSTSDNYIGYYYHLHQLNTRYKNNIETLTQKQIELARKKAELEVFKQYKVAAEQELEAVKAEILSLLGQTEWVDEGADDRPTISVFINNYPDGTKVKALSSNYYSITQRISDLETEISQAMAVVNALDLEINNPVAEGDKPLGLRKKQEEIVNNLKELHQSFTNRYGAYILEGTWQDESYVDDNKYYLDALTVAHNSSRPQINYKIDVIRLTGIDEYSSKVLHLGDICYVEDVQFFGYSDFATRTPYKERLIVSQITSCLDQPANDSITVQNYRSRFDDLFQRITATTQSLQYAEGEFSRAAGAIQPDKTLSFSVLQDTFDYNQDFVISASNQDVTWDATGITVRNKFNANDLTKILAGGIFITNDGGQTWKNAIRGDGISTNVLTAGRVNTSEIYIYDGNAPSFRWDAQGISAYQVDSSTNSVDFNKYVRFDQYGVYGFQGNTALDLNVDNPLAEIKNNCSFGLLWDGFFLKSQGNNGLFEISTTNDLVISKKDNNDYVPMIRMGRIGTTVINEGTANQQTQDIYGLIVKDNDGNDVFTVNGDGASIAGWTLTSGGLEKTDTDKGYTWGIYADNDSYFLRAGSTSTPTFSVTQSGDITAKSGTIAGWTLNSSGLSKTIGNTTFGIYSPSQTSSNFLKAGSAFSVTAAGAVTCSNLTITGGSLDIGDSYISTTGYAEFNNVKIKGTLSSVQLGNVTINNSSTYISNSNSGIEMQTTGSNSAYIQGYSGETSFGGKRKPTKGVRISSGGTTGLIASDAGAKITDGDAEVWTANGNVGFNGGTYYFGSTEFDPSSSDYRLKHDIIYDLSIYDKDYMALKPCRYTLNKDNQIRFGFIAQDIINDILYDKDFASQRIVVTGLDDMYSINYNSFIALNTYMIQKLLKRVSDLESQLAALQS